MRSLSDQLATATALLVVAVVIGVTIRFNIFVPWGTDSASYLASAYRWANGELFVPSSFVFWAPWSAGGLIESPLGNVPGAIKGTIVSVYPLGYPLILATALKFGGVFLAYAVAPLFAGLLAWCAYLLGSELSGRWAGVMASVLIASCPSTLVNAVNPMSDVPATAFWALSWVLALRPGLGAAVAAGLTTAMAITMRPNLAPLGAIIAALVFVQGWPTMPRRWTRLVAFGAAAATGPALVLWSQAVLYGDPLKAGYVGFETFFSKERIAANLALYPRLLVEEHTWLVLTGLALVPITLRQLTREGAARRRALIACAALSMIVGNYALYLPYLTFEGWWWLRFMLPALTALFLLFAATIDRLRSFLAARSRWLQPLALVPFLIVALHPRDRIASVPQYAQGYLRVMLMGRYLHEVLPPNAVILTFLQSGAAAFYTGRPILRIDLNGALNDLVGDLSRRGYKPVLLIDDAMETESFVRRFEASRYGRLDWPPRAEFWSQASMSYFDFADRERFLNGERWAIDVLTWPVDGAFKGAEHRVPVLPEFRFPPTHETLAFRRVLDEKYRDDLHRQPGPTSVDPRDSIVWIRRYIRYRIQKCPHADAVAKVLEQVAGRDVPPVCGPTRTADFPPRSELVDFRKQLEDAFSKRPRRPQPSSTHVDLEGDAVWTQEYLRYRLGRCSHAQAVERVLRQIDTGVAPPACETGGT